jgi:hypothetical protein
MDVAGGVIGHDMIHAIVALIEAAIYSGVFDVGQQSPAVDASPRGLTLTNQRRARQNLVKRS